jgi:DNA processing protein
MSVTACRSCAARCLLVAELSPLLECHRGSRERLTELLALTDEQLISALAGRRRTTLREHHRLRRPGPLAPRDAAVAICRHDARYPAALAERGGPHLIVAAGGTARLDELLGRPRVAVLDSRRASDYGTAMAASLARGLSAAAVTVVAGLHGPIGRAAHRGALQTGGGSLAVLGDGLGSGGGAPRELRRQVLETGCVISELPWQSHGRAWGRAASERIVAALGDVAIVIESSDRDEGLAPARGALALGRPLGALPGLITNPLAAGPHELIAGGARLLRNAAEVLGRRQEAGEPAGAAPPPRGAVLEGRLRSVLEAVGSGCDSAEQLCAAGVGESALAVLGALGELEALGLIGRGGAGRYVCRDPSS